MSALLTSTLLLTLPRLHNESAKEVVHTPWWPPGSEANAESIGIVSRDRVFMTAMMALNNTTNTTLAEEIQDVADISAAAETNLSALVACLVNTKANQSDHIRELMQLGLAPYGLPLPALTVVEMIGEYNGRFDFTMSCQAVRPSLLPKKIFKLPGGTAHAVVAAGLVHMTVSASTVALALEQTAALESLAGAVGQDGDWIAQALECSVYVRSADEAATFRSALSATAVPPSMAIVRAPTSGGAALSLSCTSLLASLSQKRVVQAGDATANVGNGFVYTTIRAARPNATDAYEKLGELLLAAGSRLEDVVSCHFYMRQQPADGYPKDLFAGFLSTFNQAHPPPPTRAEFVALDLVEPTSEVVVQCVAALPLSNAWPVVE